jgi:hypothetical protein
MSTPAFQYVQELRDNLTQLLTEYVELEEGGGGGTTPPPSGQNASGIPLPTGDMTGWKLVWSDDFDKDMALGSFPGPYADKLLAYPNNYYDTSGNGQYNPQTVLSAKDSILRKHIHTKNGQPQVAAPVPKIPNGTPIKWPGQKFGRYEVCVRFPDRLPGYKVAWLLWPDYGTNTQHKKNGTGDMVSQGIGEIDFPEVDLDQSDHVGGFMHKLNATVGNDQWSLGNKTCDMTQWHRYAIEWSNNLCIFLLDGKELGRTTDRVPNDHADGCSGSMHWVLQTETTLDGVVPDASVEGDIEIDWIAIWAKA